MKKKFWNFWRQYSFGGGGGEGHAVVKSGNSGWLGGDSIKFCCLLPSLPLPSSNSKSITIHKWKKRQCWHQWQWKNNPVKLCSNQIIYIHAWENDNGWITIGKDIISKFQRLCMPTTLFVTNLSLGHEFSKNGLLSHKFSVQKYTRNWTFDAKNSAKI